jgi:tetratricopeptide (TPR) repeat protein
MNYSLKVFKNIFNSILFWIGFCVVTVAALISTTLPLFNLLDYEASLLLAIVISFVILPLSANFTRKGISKGEVAQYLWIKSLLVSLMLLITPLFIMIISGLYHGQCGWNQGFIFFFFYPVLSALIGASAGFTLGRITSKWWIVVVALLVPLISILIEVLRFYLYPPIFSYDPFFGFFSGAFYDPLVEITPAFWFARSYHLLGSMAAVLMVMILKKDLLETPHKIMAGAATLLFILFWFLAPTMEFRFNREEMKKRLGGHIETRNFHIYYSDKIPKPAVKIIAAQAEFSHEELTHFFKVAPSGKIAIWIFANTKEKRSLFGAEMVEVAKPWLKEVYITYGNFPHHSLKHELAHIFAGSYGDSWFKVSMSYNSIIPGISIPSPNPGLIEGAAVAASFELNGVTFHQKAKILYDLRMAAPMKVVFSSMFYALSSSRAYTQAGSFYKWLYDTYGSEKTFKLYKDGGGYEKLFGKSITQLEKEYIIFIKTIKIDEKMVAMAKARFSRRPMHKRRCLHEVAREVKKAQLLIGEKDYDSALDVIDRAMGYDPNSLNLMLFYVSVARDAKRYDKVEKIACTIFDNSQDNPLIKARSQLILVEIAWLKGDLTKAKKDLNEIAKMNLSRGMERRIKFIEEIFTLPEKNRNIMKNLLLTPIKYKVFIDKLLTISKDFPLASYIAASFAMGNGEWERSADLFSKIDENSLPNDNFRCEFLKRALLANFLSRRFDNALSFSKRLNKCPQGEITSVYYNKFIAFLKNHPKSFPWDPKGTHIKE